MNQHHFTAWTRLVTHLPSRRDVLRGLASAGLGLAASRLPETAEGKKKRKNKNKNKKNTKNRQAPPPPAAPCTPKCGRKECGDDGCGGSCGGCAADQVCVTGTCCTPQPLEVTCTMRCSGPYCPHRCDTVTDPGACSQPVACSCPSGQECLGNGSCGQVCEDASDCPGQFAGCNSCGTSADGMKYCSYHPGCPNQACTTTADCPIGEHCQVTSCGPGGSSKTLCVRLSLCTG